MTKSANNKRYQPQVKNFINLCESNYLLLIRLTQNLNSVGAQVNFSISERLHYSIRILEVTRYTCVAQVEQHQEKMGELGVLAGENSDDNISIKSLLTPQISVRLYHDARLAEVVSAHGVSRLRPRYDYPNDKMHQPDEKYQSNAFLGQWLHVCLQHGMASIENTDTTRN